MLDVGRSKDASFDWNGINQVCSASVAVSSNQCKEDMPRYVAIISAHSFLRKKSVDCAMQCIVGWIIV